LNIGYNCLYATDPTLRAWLDSHDPDWEVHQDQCSGGTIPTVSTNSVSSITSNSAVCGGNVTSDGGSTVTTRGVCWGTSSNPTTSNFKTTNGTGTGSFTSYIYGLNSGTTYYVRAYAINSNGTSYGSNVSFITTSASTTPTVTTSSVSSITSNSAVCGGDVTSDGGATVTARGICWSTSPNPITSNSKTNDGSGTGSFTSYIYGLSPLTTYYVRAYATNNNGTSYGSNMIFATNPASTLSANFYGTPTSGKVPLTVQFYDQSQPGEDASITSWYWDFCDGTTASGKNPTHTYNNPGIYDVKLTVQNSSGYEDSEIKNNYITVTSSSSTPTADFSGIPTSGSAPLTVQFYDQSTPGSGAIVTSWEWEFGDGSTSFNKNPTHTYTSQGTYTVKLSVTNSFGNSDTITKKNYVKTCNNCLLYRLPFPGGINMKITNGYGKDRHKHENKDYYCVDFNLTGDSDAGIPVLAVADGIVKYAKFNTGGYGFRVVVDHGNGITSNYSHGASINVNEGEFVEQGQELMVIWDTGTAFGFHLHFGMRENDESMPLPQFSGCTNGCSFNPIEANGYTSDNIVNNPGKIIEENEADISGSLDGEELYYGHNRKYSWKYAKEGTSTTTATYRPRFSKKVTCDIFVYVPPFNATTTAAKYKVKHVSGSETFTVNQLNVPANSSVPNNWVRLGDKTFEFGSGTDYYVQIGNGVDNYKKDQRVGFDAVYFKINESGGGGDPIVTPKIGLNRTTFNFGAIASGPSSESDTLFINNTGKGTLKWTATSNASWLNISPKSGTNSGTINISVNSTGLYAGTYIGEITIADPNASNSPRTVSVTLKVYQWGWTDSPFGEFATPTDHSTVRSSIPVTGWTLDDVGMESVKIYRTNGKNKVYIGDAVFVEGARPDVEQAYPTYPNNYKAGWGYMLLTNFLPNNDNGTFTLLAIATDIEGNQVTLGTKTIFVDNANAVKPFGAIDTPAQGGTASGSNYRNWGWVLTPQPNMIPTNGSTIKVWVDGVKLGHPTYNIYRPDIASLFPGYANSNGAAGYFEIDTTAYDNGVHTIQWTATDSGGNTDGIGSRYFIVQNIGSSQSSSAAIRNTFVPGYKDLIDIPISYAEPIKLKKGYTDNYWSEDLLPDTDGITHIQCKELERMDIQVCQAGIEIEGYMMVGNRLMSLPVGSTLEKKRGRFRWIPGPGFVGTYSLVFIETNKYGEKSKKHILVTIDPKFSRE
jgi:PKD repeat protein